MDFDYEEYERRRYIILRNKLSIINSNLYILDSKRHELESLLNSGFKINNEIAEKESIDTIANNINDVIEGVNFTTSIANNKI